MKNSTKDKEHSPRSDSAPALTNTHDVFYEKSSGLMSKSRDIDFLINI
jgi:hypothetical protein